MEQNTFGFENEGNLTFCDCYIYAFGLHYIVYITSDQRYVNVISCLLLIGGIFLLTGLRIYMGEYKAQGPTLCPTEGRALRGPRALYSPV